LILYNIFVSHFCETGNVKSLLANVFLVLLQNILFGIHIIDVHTSFNAILDLLKTQPHTGSGTVMHADSCVDFGTIWIVCLCVYLTPFVTFFLIFFLSLSFLLIYFLTRFLTDLSTYSFQNRCILFPGRRS